jgi:hypothetical protein
MIAVMLVSAQVIGTGQAAAAPAEPTPAQPGPSQPGRGHGGSKPTPGPASLVVPGTGERRAAFTTLTPTGPRALPGSEQGRAATLDPATAAVTKPGRPADGAVKLRDAVVPVSSAQSWYCDEAIGRSAQVGEDPESGRQSLRLDYLAEVGCNVYLAGASGVAGVIDRSDGGFDGQLLHVGTPFSFAWYYYGASAGALEVDGSQYDGARRVEIVFELYLRSPEGIPWGACNPLVGLRYLLCEGLGSDLLHIVVGTGAFNTGLRPPVIEQVALGDSYASGNAADAYYGPSGCFRSMNNYAWQISGSKSPNRVTVDTPLVAACSGARINDIERGAGLPPKHATPPQINFLDRTTTRLVTITVGGNDLRFSDRLKDCILRNCSGAPLFNPSDLQTVQTRLADLYRSIRDKMRPEGVLAVMTYPNIFPAIGDTNVDFAVCPFYVSTITAEEQARIDQATTDVRNMLAGAVAATGDPRVVLVDTVDALRGHSICSRSPWASGFDLSDLDIFESFHPNNAGHGAEAQRIRDRLALSLT